MADKQTMEAIEKTIDSTADTFHTLERIPKADLNGTTKQQQVLILSVVSLASLAVGAGLTYGWVVSRVKARQKKNQQTIKDFAEGKDVS